MFPVFNIPIWDFIMFLMCAFIISCNHKCFRISSVCGLLFCRYNISVLVTVHHALLPGVEFGIISRWRLPGFAFWFWFSVCSILFSGILVFASCYHSHYFISFQMGMGTVAWNNTHRGNSLPFETWIMGFSTQGSYIYVDVGCSGFHAVSIIARISVLRLRGWVAPNNWRDSKGVGNLNFRYTI